MGTGYDIATRWELADQPPYPIPHPPYPGPYPPAPASDSLAAATATPEATS